MNKKLLTEALKKENAIVVFYADWCEACKVASPLIKEIADKLEFKLVRINENTDLEQEFEVDYYPHMVVAYKGTITHHPGLHSIKEFYENII
jgi:thiol-disulfide isomerase/thioredoxin